MTKKILLVDDELLLLNSLRRELSLQYDIDTAESGAEGLEKIANSGPYAVIVSDFRMPKMDGVKFLTHAMEIAPNTVRMMLTGNADLPTAIEAINKGQIFRFLSKPCSGTMLTQSLDAGLRQYQLIMAEKELLERTLKESISMLIEVLAIVNPKAYGRTLRIQQNVSHIVKQLKIENGWQYETAASLSQLGWIIFPQQMLEKIESNQAFSAAEAVIFSKHPFATSKLLQNIPRLELITRMIVGQDRSIDDLCLDPDYPEAYTVDLGSHILKICIDYDQLLLQGLMHDQVIARLQARRSSYQPEILATIASLQSYTPQPIPNKVEIIALKELEDGMVVLEPIRDMNGNILVDKHTLITRAILMKLLGLGSQLNSVVEPLKVVRRAHRGA
jgi:response regulator RpfG family c-di-GMP phosphodiesterase